MKFDTLGVSSQDDSAREATQMFEKPCISGTQKVPGANVAESVEETFLPSSFLLDLMCEGSQASQMVFPLVDNYIINLLAMVSTLVKVAVCSECKEGTMEIFELNYTASSATKFLLRCNNCHNSIVFLGVGDFNSVSTNALDASSVLGSCIVGLNSRKMRTYHACLGLPPAPNAPKFIKIRAELITAAEEEAKASMERAVAELKSSLGLDSTTKRVHASASIDGAYHASSCFSSAVSTQTGKVLAYEIASNGCSICTRYRNKDTKDELLDDDRLKWDDHKKECQAKYTSSSNIHLESAVAPEVIKQAHKRGVVFSTLVCDGDNDTVGSLNKLDIYKKLGIDMNIRKIECLTM